MLNRLKIIELTGVPNPRNSPWHSAIAEAIPPLFLKLETTASVFLLKFTNYSVRLQTTVFFFCITSSFELLSSTLGEQQKISFIATLQNI
jgi:hypothetical protein